MSSLPDCKRKSPGREGVCGDMHRTEYLAALLLIVCAMQVSAFAVLNDQDGQDAADAGGDFGTALHWKYTEADKKITISYIGSGNGEQMPDYGEQSDTPWQNYLSSAQQVEIKEKVTSVGNKSFYDASNVTSVTIGGDVTSVGDSAFSSCCAITSVTIPDSVTSIGKEAFYGCRGLTSVMIGKEVTSIAPAAFYGCTSLTSVTIPDKVTTIGDSAFGYSGLTSVTIPDSVTSIGKWAFYGCRGLTSVTIPDKVTSIGEEAFQDCTGLASVTIGNNVESIGKSAFKGCTSLESVEIPAKVESIGERVFESCAKLEQINVADDSQNYSSVNGVLFNKDKTELIAYPQGLEGHYDVPDGVTTIKGYAFYYASKLASVTFPVSTTTVESYAFYNCENLNVVYINASILDITGGWPPSRDVLFIYANGGYVTGSAMDTDKKFPSADKFTAPGGKAFKEYKTVKEGEGTSYKPGDDYSLTGKQIVYAIWADISGDDGNIHWVISGDTLTLNKKDRQSSGDMKNYNSPSPRPAWESGAGWGDVTKVVIKDDVTSIGECAFYSCTSLASVTFGNNSQLGSIGFSAFYGCASLGSITIPAAVTSIGFGAFYKCTDLASVIFGNESKLTSIRDGAFQECGSLSSITIPAAVTSIGQDAFKGCTSLNTVYYNASDLDTSQNCWPSGDDIHILFIDANGGYVTGSAMDPQAKKFPSAKDFSAPEGKAFKEYNTAEDGKGTYYKPGYDYSLTGKQIIYAIWAATSGDDGKIHWAIDGDTLTLSRKEGESSGEMNDYSDETRPAWESGVGWGGVTKVVIQDGVTSIGNCAFQDCTSLGSVTIPASVTSIGNYAFFNCESLRSVTIPGSVTSIGEYAFDGCTSLTSISVDGNNAQYSSQDGVLFNKEKTELIQYPIGNISTSYSIPNSVESIGDSAFDGCTFLTSVIIPGSVKSIGPSAFDGCTSLTSVTIPGSVKSIGGYAFYDCTSLTSVTIGNSVESIRSSAFRYCTSLATIIFETDTWNITSIGEDQFALGTQTKSVSATVYSKSNIADGKLDDYRGVYASFAYQQLLLETVKFDANGGTSSEQTMKTGLDGKLSSLPTATRDGYTLDGWYTQAEGGEEITTSYVFTQDTTVYAHWTASPSPGPTPSSGNGTQTIAIVGAVLAALVIIGFALLPRKR